MASLAVGRLRRPRRMGGHHAQYSQAGLPWLDAPRHDVGKGHDANNHDARFRDHDCADGTGLANFSPGFHAQKIRWIIVLPGKIEATLG